MRANDPSVKDKKRNLLGTILMESRIIGEKDIHRALEEQARSGIRFGEALKKLGVVSDDDVEWALANQFDIPFVRIRKENVDKRAVAAVPSELARRFGFVPFLLLGEELTIVADDPLDSDSLLEIEKATGFQVNLALGLTSEIVSVLDQVYGERDDTEAQWPGIVTSSLFDDRETEQIAADLNGEVFLMKLLEKAVESGACTIHLEPGGESAKVRFRTNSDLTEVAETSSSYMAIVSRRLRELSDLPAKLERFADGFLTHRVGDRDRTFYLSQVETPRGTATTLVNVTRPDFPVRLEDLADTDAEATAISEILGRRQGLIVLTGTEKVTRMNLAMRFLDQMDAQHRKAVAVGPVWWFGERDLLHIRANTPGGFSYSEAIRSALSHEPDLLIVEEMWDPDAVTASARAAVSECAAMACVSFPKARETFCFLCETVGNLTLVASALAGIFSIVRLPLLCPHCRETLSLDADLPEGFEPTPGKDGTGPHRAVGCPQCNNTGHQGARYVLEVCIPGGRADELVRSGSDASAFEEFQRLRGFKPLREKIADLVRGGEVSIEEYRRIYGG